MLLRTSFIRIYSNSIVAFLIIAILAGFSFFLVIHSGALNLLPYKISYLADYKDFNRVPHYCDLDLDGKSEHLIFTRYSGVDVVEVFDEHESFIEVYHVSGSLLDAQPSYMVSDMDLDGKAELYLVSVRNDSLLLNGIEITGDDGHFITDHFIAGTNASGTQNNMRLLDIRAADLDHDGKDEIIMALRAGLSLSPRMIYSINPITMESRMTANTAASYLNMMLFKDRKGAIERVVTGTAAFENYERTDTNRFNDQSGWIIHYSPDLARVLFSREYPAHKSYVYSILKETADGPFIFAMILEMNRGRGFLEKISLDGNLVKRVPIGTGMNKYLFINTIFEDLDPLVALHSDTMYFYDYDLELKGIQAGAGELLVRFYGQSCNNARSFRNLVFLSGKSIYIRDNEMNLVAKARINEPLSVTPGYFSVKSSIPPGQYVIGIAMEKSTLHFSFSKNRFYPFRVVVYLLLFAVLFLGFYLIFILQHYFFTRRQMNQRKISELQLQNVQNQLQPHFTFNVLNTIGSLIYQDKKDKAYEYLNYFSDMLRSTLLSRSSSEWQLGEELSFIGTYMEMENLRFENRFRFRQRIDSGIALKHLVPKMSVQAFVENAIRHGLMHKPENCLLVLKVRTTDTHLEVEVEDNGIGRAAAGKLQRHGSGIGNEILQDYMDVYNRIHKTKFIFTIQDLVNEDGSAAGTKVTLLIPKDFRSQN